MLVGVGVADHGRILPCLPHHGETVGSIRTRRGPTVCPAAPSTGRSGAGTVTAQHQTVEIKPDLEIFQSSDSPSQTIIYFMDGLREGNLLYLGRF